MNHRIAAIAAAAAFASGLVVGRYASPREQKISTAALQGANKPIVPANTGSREADIPRTSSVDVSASVSAENLIYAIQKAVAHPGDRQLYSEISDIINALDPGNVRRVVDAIEHLPNPRKRNVFMSMLISRWAEADPPAALAYVRTKGVGAENNDLLSSIVTTWAENDAAAVTTWVTQLPAGQERSQAVQSLVSVLAEEKPDDALN